MSDTIAPPAAPQHAADPRLPDPDDGLSRPNYGDGGGDDPQPGPQPDPTDLSTPPTPPAALPDDGQEESEEPEPDPLRFLVGNRKLGVKVGGFKPDSSVLKIKGGKIDLDGQYDMGDRFPAVFTLQVTGNGDKHSIELDTGTIKSQSRAQEATICQTASLPDYLVMKLGDDPALLAKVLGALDLEPTAGE